MDIAVDTFFSALFYVVCGAAIGSLVGWSLTYLWCHPEPVSQPTGEQQNAIDEAMQAIDEVAERAWRDTW